MLTEIIDRMPAEMTFLSGCTVMPGPSVPCNLSGQTLTWTFSPSRPISQNQFVMVSFQAEVNGLSAGDVITNEAEAHGDNFATSTYLRRIYAYTPTPTSTPITIPVANDDPGPAPAAYVTNEDVPLNVAAPGVLANDVDAAWDTLNASILVDPSNGGVVLNTDGSFTYIPSANFYGSDSFTYQACDGGGACDWATVSITVNSVLDAPITLNDTYDVDEDQLLTVVAPGVLGNDTDGDPGDVLTVRLPVLSAPSNGLLSLNGDGSFTYMPGSNFKGGDQFTYRACDLPVLGFCDTATAFITVNSINDPPTAADDSVTTDEDNAVTIDVLANDYEDPVEGDTLSVFSVTQGSNGAVTFTAGNVTYSPSANWFGTDAFTYTISDGNGGFDTADVVVTVNSVNDPPIAVDDPWPAAPPIIIGQGSFILRDVWANDYENPVEGDTLFVSGIFSTPASGGASTAVVDNASTPGDVTDDHSILYTPDPLFHHPTLPDTFVYTLSDGNGGTAQATVSIIVNDAPVAVADSYTLDEDSVLAAPGLGPIFLATLLDNDSDPNGDPLQAELVTGPTQAQAFTLKPDGSFSYTPNANYYGPDSFSYNATDGGLNSNVATVSLTVAPVNDLPVANLDAVRTNMNISLVIDVLANDTDIDLDALSVGSVDTTTLSTLGTVTNNVGNVTYNPVAAFVGPDAFIYESCDPGGLCDSATVSVFVSGPPYAENDSYSTDEDTPLIVPAVGVLNNDGDLDLDPVTAVWSAGPSSGTVTLNPNGSFTYSPNLNFAGSDSFTYEACDPGDQAPQPQLCAGATVSVTVIAANDPPIANNDSYTIDEDVTTNFNVISNDSDIDGTIDPATVQIITPPQHGLATPNPSGMVTYNPNLNYNGSDSFTYTVDDNDGATSNVATVSITINAVNDPPIALDDSYTTSQRFMSELSRLVVLAPGVMANDVEPEGQAMTITFMSTPAHQTTWLTYPWEWLPDGSFNYAPLYNYHGLDSFTYTVCDPTPLCSTGTVRIAVNDPPVASDDPDPAFPGAYTVDEDQFLSVAVGQGVLFNDTDENAQAPADLPYDVISASVASGPSDGVLTLNPDGSFTYDPDPDYFGPDSFTYEACDQGVAPIQPPLCDSALVSLTVNAVNDAPVASDDSDRTNYDRAVTIDVLGNDTDVESDTLLIEAFDTTGTAGTVSGTTDAIYTPPLPASGFYGVDTFAYSVCDRIAPDPEQGCDWATARVFVSVTPNAQDDNYGTSQDTQIALVSPGVLGNDSDVDGDTINASLVSPPSHAQTFSLNGNGAFSYLPEPSYYGSDEFTYAACDPGSGPQPPLCVTAVVTLTVSNVEDTPAAVDDIYSLDEDDTLPVAAPGVLSNDIDADNLAPPPWTGLVVNTTPIVGPAHAALFTLNSDGSFSYTPTGNYNGGDSFEYEICDLTPLCDTAVVSITINPINDAPIAVDDPPGPSTTTNEDVPFSIDVLTNDSDPDIGDTISVSAVTNGARGTVTNNGGDVTYTPNLNDFGTDTFNYTITDGNGGFDTATVDVVINAVNDPPVAQDDTASTSQFSSISIAVLSNDNDVDGGPLVIQSFDAFSSQGATITQSGSNLVYTPGLYSDPVVRDTFTYIVSDGFAGTDSATVSVLVNDAPQAADDGFSTDEDTALNAGSPGVQSNDSDPNGDPLTVSIGSGVSHGSITLNGDGSFTYDPAPNYFGPDSFSYQICDAPSGGACDTASVDLTVNSVNDLPVAGNDSGSTDQVTASSGGWSLPVAANDSDIEGPLDLSSIVIVSAPSYGTAGPNPGAPGEVIYTLTDGRSASDSFSYTIRDADGTSSNSATVSISITPPNLRVDELAQPDSVAVGDSVTFYITVWNEGPGTAYGVQLTDQLGSCFRWVGGSPSGPLGDLADGAARVVTAQAQLESSTDCEMTNTASVSSSNGASGTITISVGLLPTGGAGPASAAVLPTPSGPSALATATQTNALQATFSLFIPLMMIIGPFIYAWYKRLYRATRSM
ncbi:MAG: DUF11 domain-containing protein [Anaerolineales bacterium]|nr:MAG: DUF11 domain-containing protein [Anaerolineales bacterium]